MDEPHLCLFASRSLEPGEQVLYDYGVELPFRDLVCYCCFFLFITYKLVSGNKGLNIEVHCSNTVQRCIS